MAELSYRQQLALFCLANEGEACTGAVLMESMGEAALAAGHPRECWTGFTPAKIVADLKELEKRSLVVRSTPARNVRRSRDEPTWEVVKKADEFDMPDPPCTQPAVVEAPRSVYDDLPREQLVALLETHEGVAELVGNFMQQMSALQRDAVRRLRAVGFKVGPER